MRKKKILVLGIKGMAGHVILKYFQELENYDVFGLARNIETSYRVYNLDVYNTQGLRNIIFDNKFDYIINCIGILNQNAEDDPSKAIWFNSYFPHLLARITKESETQIIHISTDCVFSGKDGGGYTEKSQKNGIGFYAQSKALGEIDNSKDLTIRTSIIGPEINSNGIGLLHWFLTQARGQVLNGYSQVYWSGITTIELAKVIDDVIRHHVTGLKQISRDKISKFELLTLFNDVFRNNEIKIVENSEYKSDKSLKSIRDDYSYEVPAYRRMLLDVREWMEKSNMYKY
jgi:dTDP-4-dehydrorhamnose reductase